MKTIEVSYHTQSNFCKGFSSEKLIKGLQRYSLRNNEQLINAINKLPKYLQYSISTCSITVSYNNVVTATY